MKPMLRVRTSWCGDWRKCFVGLAVLAGLFAGCERETPPAPSTPPAPKAAAPAAAASAPAPALVLPKRTPGARTGTFVDREEPSDLRLVDYNVDWNTIFVEVDAPQATKFARLVNTLNPDILTMQEIGSAPGKREGEAAKKRTAEDVVKVLNQIIPLGGGATWHAFQGKDCVTASRYPLKLTAEKLIPAGDGELAAALVDLPDQTYGMDFYILNNHYKCCDPEKNDPRRQKQSDALVRWIRDARTSGDNIDLPDGTAFAVVGDLNIVGSFQPVQTLLTGDVIDEAKYGPDYVPDWDDSPLADAHPLHNVVGPDDWTWRNDTGQFQPGRLDYILFTDSVFEAVKKFALDTTTMSEGDLAAAGLQKFDVTADEEGKNYDHLPLVVDFRAAAGAAHVPGD
jgi:endonuclease/exonuclease/phosphatase family metal-dependent hydrolase